jgi:hypothetical protein
MPPIQMTQVVGNFCLFVVREQQQLVLPNVNSVRSDCF